MQVTMKYSLPLLTSAAYTSDKLKSSIEKQYALKTGREAAILACSKNATEEEIQAALDKEKEILRKADKQYWKPIRNEIKIMRQEHRKRK